MSKSSNSGAGILAVDIGATKIALGIVDSQYSIHSKEELIIGNSSAVELWERIANSTSEILGNSQREIIGIGIASAGPIDIKNGTISPVNIHGWRNFPVVKNFQSFSESTPVVLHGDAMALAHAEHKVGAGIGRKNMLGMVVSTGIGGGLIINNSLVVGDTGNAGYIGHQTINFDGELCRCGRRGCIEMYASGPNMVKAAQSKGWNSGTDFTALAESARQGNAIAIDVINKGTHALAQSIVNTAGALDIHTVVIGGGVSQAGDIYWNPLMANIEQEAQHEGFLNDLEILPAKLQRDAGLIGASLAISNSQGNL